MMTFSHPEYFLLLPLIFLLLLWVRKPRQWVLQPSRRQVRKSSIVSRAALKLPLFLWFFISCLVAIALASPATEKKKTYLTIEKRMFVFCYDASTSMGSGPESSMEKVRTLALDFVRRRKGDFMGVSAYSGFPNPPRGRGYAAILTYPTDDLLQVEAAINSVESKMFGSHTAMGDGIFISIVALIEEEVKIALGSRFDKWKLDESLDSIGTDHENLDYMWEVVDAIGKQKGKFILLFTDGTFNTGLHPAKALRLAEELDIRVHLIALAISGPTGLSAEDQVKNKETTIRGILTTGGLYRESNDIAGIGEIFDEIDRTEKSRIVVQGEPREEPKQLPLFILSAILLLLWIVTEILWIKVP